MSARPGVRLPRFEPMLATPHRDLFVSPEWVFEVKWDGVRTLLYWDGVSTTLLTRTGKNATERYPELTRFSGAAPCVLDGEVVALDRQRRPSFERLQRRMNLRGSDAIRRAMEEVPVEYVVFDVLYDGTEVVAAPWQERRGRLQAMALPAGVVASTVIDTDPDPLWQFVTERRLEGIVAKRRSSPYRPGTRSPDWLKITRFSSLRAVVAGFTPGESGRSGTFGALLLGLWTAAGLRWVGAVGSGFDDRSLHAIRAALDEMTVGEPVLLPDPELPGDAVYVEPRLVAMVQYKEWTSAGRLRGPSFKGFTDDDVAAVTWDREGPPSSDQGDGPQR